MSDIDTAIARLQDIALALSTIPDVAGNLIAIKSAPDYPIENLDPLPMVSTYLSGGEFHLTNATIHHNFPVIAVEFHFSRVNLKQAYKQIYAVAVEFPQRLAGDPTLNGSIQTIVGGGDNPIPYTVRPFVWKEQTQTQAQLLTQMIRFDIPIKLLKAPVTTT